MLQGQAHIVDLRKTESVQTIRFDPPGSHQHNISGLAFSPQVNEITRPCERADVPGDARHTCCTCKSAAVCALILLLLMLQGGQLFVGLEEGGIARVDVDMHARRTFAASQLA